VQPFFITGFQRSGTTLLRVMLDSHPDIAVPLDVTGLWWRFESGIARFGDLRETTARRAIVAALLDEPRIRLWNVPLSADDVLGRWSIPGYPGAIAAFYEAYAAHFGKRLWGDKDPGNMSRIDDLDRWFPGCRVIHIIRDGRAACASLVKQDFGSNDLMHCADQWREEVSWVRRIGRLLGPSRWLEVRYETLVTAPAGTLRATCDFLGVAFSEEMLRYNTRLDRSIPEDKRHIWPLIGEEPRADNAQRWRQSMSRAVQVCFEKRAGELLTELGYATSDRPWRGHYRTELGFLAARVVRTLRHRLGR
jgi:hypothetical protein